LSWYLANESEIIDQFASGQGRGDLTRAGKGYPALKDFFDAGATNKIMPCIHQLGELARKTRDATVRDTAKGLAKLLRGQKFVSITQGLGDAESDNDFLGDRHDPRRKLFEEAIADLGFPKPAPVTSLRSIAHLFGSAKSRCGIYLLIFPHDRAYIGQAVEVVRRFAQHRGSYENITAFSFIPMARRNLGDEERLSYEGPKLWA